MCVGQPKGQGAVKSSLVPDYDSSGVVGLPEFRVSFAIGAYHISRFCAYGRRRGQKEYRNVAADKKRSTDI